MSKSFIYTRTGDTGTTSLVGGTRIDKDAPRLEAYGTIDELNSHLGLLYAEASSIDATQAPLIRTIQSRLFDIGSYLATDGAPSCSGLTDGDIARLESTIDSVDGKLEPLRSFVLPGGCMAASECHVCRTVCRRAERLVVGLTHMGISIDPRVIRYLNRLSDYLFVLARELNLYTSTPEIKWEPGR